VRGPFELVARGFADEILVEKEVDALFAAHGDGDTVGPLRGFFLIGGGVAAGYFFGVAAEQELAGGVAGDFDLGLESEFFAGCEELWGGADEFVGGVKVEAKLLADNGQMEVDA